MKKIWIFMDNHFDLTWRRCFDREFTYEGNTFVSYAQLEDYYISDHLALAEKMPEYRFGVESTAVIRKFLERHPEQKENIITRLQNGQLYIPLAGDNIVDTNMVSGETIVRNYVYGLLWLENNLRHSPKICTRNDAFGNCAQLPQIVNGCEAEGMTAISYCPCPADYWEGMDGSRVLIQKSHSVGHGGGFIKYSYCPDCHGDAQARKTCQKCGGRGIDLEKTKRDRFSFRLDHPQQLERDGWGVLVYGGEEILPNEDVFNWIEAHKEEYDISFATLPMISEKAGIPENATVFRGELNPSSTGCFVSRIKTKQRFREAEYALLNAETLCTMGFLNGSTYPRQTLERIWQKLLFAAFHDAVTGTHVDPAYVELMDVLDEIDEETQQLMAHVTGGLVRQEQNVISVVNPTGDVSNQIAHVKLAAAEGVSLADERGNPVDVLCVRNENGMAEVAFAVQDLKPFEVRRYSVKGGMLSDVKRQRFAEEGRDVTRMTVLRGEDEADEVFSAVTLSQTIENDRFKVTADDFSIIEIFDKKLHKTLSVPAQYRPGEWILEHDEGSPWTTLSEDKRRFRLAPYTRMTEKETSACYSRLTFVTEPPYNLGYSIKGIKITTTVTLWQGIERVDFESDVFWDTMNHRLRFALPVSIEGESLYEVPYGFMNRKPYLEKNKPIENHVSLWNAASGDWPAINWAGVSGEGASVAFLNHGLPSYIIEDGAIFLSVLRSPGVPICLNEPGAYTALNFDGMRDSGRHHFSFALTAYDRSLPQSTVVADANGYQAGVLCVKGAMALVEMPTVAEKGVRISSVKQTEDGKGLVIRLAECSGEATTAIVRIPAQFSRVYETNLLERQERAISIENTSVELSLGAFQIKTLVCY